MESRSGNDFLAKIRCSIIKGNHGAHLDLEQTKYGTRKRLFGKTQMLNYEMIPRRARIDLENVRNMQLRSKYGP